MVEKTTAMHDLPDAEAEARAGQAESQQHVLRDGDGAWVTNNGHVTNARDPAGNTSYSNYLFGRAGASDRPLWSDSFKGRVAIRLVSRGIVGALAMTVMDRVARVQLRNYDAGEINSWSAWWKVNPSQKIAKAIDYTAGRTIQGVVRSVAPAERAAEYASAATSFRHKAYYFDEAGKHVGRSLGADMVGVTMGFSAASLGDASVRNLAQLIDPNAQKIWRVNDQGEVAKPGEHAHTDWGKWFGSTARTTWRVVTKNAGEDWAVALPYVFQMRWQRNLLAKHFPDSKLNLDNSWNGGSMHLGGSGGITGDFQLPGAIDLHARFVGYNWYTLMYRETYDAVGRQLQHWKENGFSLRPNLPHNPIAAAANTVGYGARYVAKSFIKSNLYMQPAVIPFWMMRVPQSKWRAGMIATEHDPKQNAIGNTLAHPSHTLGNNEELFHMARDGGWQHRYNSAAHQFPADPGLHLHEGYSATELSQVHFGDHAVPAPGFTKKAGSVFSKELIQEVRTTTPRAGLFSAFLNPFGLISYKAGTLATKAMDATLHSGEGRFSNFLARNMGGRTPFAQREMFMRQFVDNSLAYTPYMIAKAETALRVDERPADGGLGDMDKAIYKFIDSSVRFDIKNVGASLGDIWHSATHRGTVRMREGGEVESAPIIDTEDRPATRVQAESVQRTTDPVALERQDDQPPDDKRWAESVAGRPLSGRFHSAAHTLH